MKTIKKSICLLLTLILLVPFYAYAEARSWYCMRKKDHNRPVCEGMFSFITEYDCAYIGKNPDEKVIYLTFDAGYSNENLISVLDTLKEKNVSGAFFILDNLVRRNPELVIRMAQDGHAVCNHTSNHKDMTKLGYEQFSEEITSLEKFTAEKTGVSMAKFYRPPEGKISKENLEFAEKLGYKTVMWSLAYADWDNSKQPSPEYAKKLLADNTHNGAVILLHPTSHTNALILPEMIDYWREQGYRFGTPEELF